MNTLTFKDVFSAEVEIETKNGGGTVRVNVRPTRIVIPNVQRDFAQGRSTAEVSRIRKNFLDALAKAVTGTAIKLDFIYGDLSGDGILTPLDGQQRLTTLFLLHWYAARRDNIPPPDWEFLKNFSYERPVRFPSTSSSSKTSASPTKFTSR